MKPHTFLTTTRVYALNNPNGSEETKKLHDMLKHNLWIETPLIKSECHKGLYVGWHHRCDGYYGHWAIPLIGSNGIPTNSPWLPFGGDHFGGSGAHCGGLNDVNSCISLTRIAIVLGYYKEWLDERIITSLSQLSEEKQPNTADHKSMYDFVNKIFDSENGYSNHQLLNDYHHLINDHSHQFDAIHNRIIKQCGTKDEDGAHLCYFIKRNYRNKHEFNKETHNELYFTAHHKERSIQQILDTICCYFMYSYRFGFIANQLMHDQIKPQTTDDDTPENGRLSPRKAGLVFKSFGRASLEKKARYKKPKQVQEMLNMLTLIKTNRNTLRHTLPKDVYEAIYEKKNRFMSITRFVMGKHESKEEKDDENQNEFGYRYYYDDKYKHNREQDLYNKGSGRYKDWYIVPKYISLKEESLHSKCIKLDVEQWNELFEKANCYLRSDIGKDIKVDASHFALYVEGSSITVDHLVAILLYTNFAHVEYELSVTCRKLSPAESNQSLKERNSHLANLSRYLGETVHCFGRKPEFSKPFEYFHVINKAIELPSCSCITYNAPLSVTTSKMVGMNALCSYDGDGLLLEISARDTKQFDCKWFSDNTNEYETLLFQCKNAITVQNVIDVELGINYHIYLYAFRILHALLDGSDVNKKQRGMHFEVSDAASLTPIYKYLYQKFYAKHTQTSLPLYIEQILNSYCDNLTQIEIRWNQMAQLKRKVTGYGDKNKFDVKIIGFIQPFVCYYHIEWIKWHLMLNAFKQLKCITIHGIKITKTIFEDILFHLNKMKKDHVDDQCCLEQIIFKSPTQRNFGCAKAVQIYNQRFATLQWRITNPSYSELHISKIY